MQDLTPKTPETQATFTVRIFDCSASSTRSAVLPTIADDCRLETVSRSRPDDHNIRAYLFSDFRNDLFGIAFDSVGL